MKEIHSCEQMELADTWIEYHDDVVFAQTATEEDIMNNHQLDMLGEAIFQASLAVSFCS